VQAELIHTNGKAKSRFCIVFRAGAIESFGRKMQTTNSSNLMRNDYYQDNIVPMYSPLGSEMTRDYVGVVRAQPVLGESRN